MFLQWVKRKRDNGVKKVKAFAISNFSAGSVITSTSGVTKNGTGPSSLRLIYIPRKSECGDA
jgi:hypothetical protein